MRKCVCRNPSCGRCIFTERLPDFVATYTPKAHRLVTALRAIGIAVGGQAGARLAARLRLPTRAAALLRLVQAAPMPQRCELSAWTGGSGGGAIVVRAC